MAVLGVILKSVLFNISNCNGNMVILVDMRGLPRGFMGVSYMIFFREHQGGIRRKSQERMVGWVGGPRANFGIFSDLFWGFFPQLFAQFLLFFSIFAPKCASSNKKGSILNVKTMFRSDVMRNVK